MEYEIEVRRDDFYHSMSSNPRRVDFYGLTWNDASINRNPIGRTEFAADGAKHYFLIY